MAMADIAGPSQWGLKATKSKIQSRAKDGLNYLFQVRGPVKIYFVWLPYFF